jgi:hypothetical protein
MRLADATILGRALSNVPERRRVVAAQTGES